MKAANIIKAPINETAVLDKEAALFKVLADPTRLRLAILLTIKGETCVCVLAEGLDVPEYKISYHLRKMYLEGIVEIRREGTFIYYKLSKARNQLELCLQECFHGYCFADQSTVKTDMEQLSGSACENDY
jgi:DNA-binding transcriptional ArsR family regulator